MTGNRELALVTRSAPNPPFLEGRDIGCAGWRTVIRGRFPAWGAPPYVESLDHYERLTATPEESPAFIALGRHGPSRRCALS